MENGNYLIGRQPILDRNEEVVAYELLFRSAASLDTASVWSASYATARVIVNTLSGFGLEQILGGHRGFSNMELDLLMSDSIAILPRERVVLELLETLQVTPGLVERCRFLKHEGFTLALDDHEFDPLYNELYGIVDIVKVDLFQSPVEHLQEMVERFSSYSVKLLAEKVESRDQYLRCRDMGFEYFQGYYFAKPSLMEKKPFGDAGAHLLKLMRLLMDDADISDIEHAFRQSPGLTYKLLLLVNSVSLGMRVRVQNVRHAVSSLGRQQIKRWVQLCLFALGDSSGLENPLVEMAAVRAVFMEHLAGQVPRLRDNPEAADQAFMIGILSLLETIYTISIDEVIASLHLSDEVRDALAERSGILGELLRLAELVEEVESDFGETSRCFVEMGLTLEDVLAAQVRAFGWRSGNL
ncbi:EAL and HDOD domain-containing protein [Pelobacter propionicus]|uniref:Diguanylate phosphodiesterase n=1 Tax=Pelobacter propionicus (strain DSM 2379 / NBRC 103807 / OttBd1) TaxID=338966 RepID=A1AT64_PELPD|nr:EAL domain-containing protein [Pelobacter propionicus]ABL00535.1 diguanylate phosphodiesterase [Pelobacter propionicus DSM 2379]